MDHYPTLLEAISPALVAGGVFVSVVVWLVRLEGRVNAQRELSDMRAGAVREENAKIHARIDKVEKDHDVLSTHVLQQLADVRESLARIEGAVGAKH